MPFNASGGVKVAPTVRKRAYIHFEGIEQMQQRLVERYVAVSGILEGAATNAAGIYRDRAESYAPRDTGLLAGSWEVKTTYKGRTKVFVRVMNTAHKNGSRGYPYARALEYGTRKMRARPFMRPAFDATKNQMKQEIAGSIRDAVLGF